MTIGIGAMAIGVALGSGGAASAIAMTAVRRPMTARHAPTRPIVGAAAPSSCHRSAALAEAEDLATVTAGGEGSMTGESRCLRQDRVSPCVMPTVPAFRMRALADLWTAFAQGAQSR